MENKIAEIIFDLIDLNKETKSLSKTAEGITISNANLEGLNLLLEQIKVKGGE